MPGGSPSFISGVKTPTAYRSNDTPTRAGTGMRVNPGSGPIGCYRLAERVRITANSSYQLLNIQIPAQSKIIWAQIKNGGSNAITIGNAASATVNADRVALISSLPATATSTAGVTTTSTKVIAMGSTTLTTSDTGAGTEPLTCTAGRNTLTSNTATGMATTVNGRLALMPIDGGGANYFYYHPTATSGTYFSGTTDVDVVIYVEQFEMP